IYHQLLYHPDRSEDQLLQEADQPREAVCEAVGNLKRLGLVRQSWENPELLQAVGPEVGLKTLLARQEAELADRQRELAGLQAGAAGFTDEYNRWRADRTSSGAELLIGLDATRNRVEELAGAARTGILSVHADPLPPKEIARARQCTECDALDRGLALRGV